MSKLSSTANTRLSTKQTDGNINKFKVETDLVIEKAEHVISFKVTKTELDKLNTWVTNTQNAKGTRVAKAKLLRALCYLEDSVDKNDLINVIRDIS